MISRRFFLAWTALFTRGIVRPLVSAGGYLPSSLLTCFDSGPTVAMPEIRRLWELLFLIRKWFPVPLRRRTLPFTVTTSRLAAPRCVLIFGMFEPVPLPRRTTDGVRPAVPPHRPGPAPPVPPVRDAPPISRGPRAPGTRLPPAPLGASPGPGPSPCCARRASDSSLR